MSMADKAGVIWFDGKLIPWADAKIHVLTHGLHYGTGVFEGVRAYSTDKGPAIFRLHDHTKRLFNSMKILNMKIDYKYDEIFEAQKAVIKENKLDASYIRPICFFGEDSLGISVDNIKTHVCIAAWDWGTYLGKEALEKGIDVHVSSFTRHHVNAAMTKAKVTGNYVNSMLAVQQAKAAGYQEAILLDPQGYVAEGSGENIFMVLDREIFTPTLTSCLDGITRKTIMTLARAQGFTVSEKLITRDELYTCDELFFTGTAAEITPIKSVDHRPVGEGKPGPITKKIQEDYFAHVHGERGTEREWLTII